MLSKHTSGVLGTNMQCLYLIFKYFIDIFDTIISKDMNLKKKKAHNSLNLVKLLLKLIL